MKGMDCDIPEVDLSKYVTVKEIVEE